MELPRLPNAIYLKHGKDHYLPTIDGEMVKIKFIDRLEKDAIIDIEKLPRMDRIMRYGNI
jgi:hypothetical protein